MDTPENQKEVLDSSKYCSWDKFIQTHWKTIDPPQERASAPMKFFDYSVTFKSAASKDASPSYSDQGVQ